jgi:hypothetical protein
MPHFCWQRWLLLLLQNTYLHHAKFYKCIRWNLLFKRCWKIPEIKFLLFLHAQKRMKNFLACEVYERRNCVKKGRKERWHWRPMRWNLSFNNAQLWIPCYLGVKILPRSIYFFIIFYTANPLKRGFRSFFSAVVVDVVHKRFSILFNYLRLALPVYHSIPFFHLPIHSQWVFVCNCRLK